MRKSNREVNGEKVFRYSIRKYHFGAASVAVAALMFFANGAVKAASVPVSPATANTEKVNAGVEGVPPEKSLEAEGNKEIVAPEPAKKIPNKEDGAQSNPTPAKEGKIEPEKPKDTVNKAKLETLIKEVEGLNLEKYTEESVKGLKTELAKAKEVFETAQNKEEVEAAWRTLFTYKNSKLVVKKTPKLPQDNTPKPDTTNGKETVGINAENTEPNGTNIAGHNHSLNGTTRAAGSGFRATPEEVTGIEFGISNGQRDGNYSRTDRYFDTLSSNQYSRIFKFVSKSGNITSVTATSSTGRSVTLEKMDKFPNNATTYFVKAKTDVTGVSDAILSFTVKTAGGDKTAQIGVYRSLGKPTIKVPTGQKESTVDEYLKGKQETKPTIDVEVPVVPNLPSYAKMKVYLVHDNDRDKGVYDGDEWAENHNPRPTRLTAKVEVPYGRVDPKTNKTTVTIQSGDYLKPLVEGKYFVLSVIEVNNEMNTNPGIRASSFSDAATVAPAKEATPGVPTVTSDTENARVTVTPSANADHVEISIGTDKVVATKTGTTWTLSPAKAGVSIDGASGIVTISHEAAAAGTSITATAKHGNSDASASSVAVTLPAKRYYPIPDSYNATPQPSTPTQPDQGGTETPTTPSEPVPQPSQPTAPSQPASPAPAPSSAPTQAPRVAASASASSTSTQALDQEQVDKSELRALSQELDQRLKVLTTVSDPKIDAAKTVLLDAKKAISDSDLTEQGLRDAVEAVKKALASLKDVKVNDVDSKTAQDKSDVKKVAEDSKDSDKMSETNSVPVGVFVAGLLALLGVIIFWLIGRKKESELKQLSIELTKILEQLDVAKADKKVLAKAQKLLQETLDFVKEESGLAETEAKLVEQLKAIISKLK